MTHRAHRHPQAKIVDIISRASRENTLAPTRWMSRGVRTRCSTKPGTGVDAQSTWPDPGQHTRAEAFFDVRRKCGPAADEDSPRHS